MSTAARRYYLRGRRSLEVGEIEQAIESLASAIDLAPHFIDARLAHATALCRLGDVPRAAQTLRAGLGHARTEPARAALWLSLGEVLTSGGDFVAAEDAFGQAALHPAYARRAAAGRARVQGKSGRAGEAIASLLRAVGRASMVLALVLGTGSACKGSEEEKPAAAPVQPAPAPEPPKPIDTADPAAGAPPASVSAEKKAMAEKVLAHMEAIAAAGESNQNDCKIAASAMKVAMDRARGDIAEMEKMKSEAPDKEARQWFEKAYGGRMMSIMGKVINIANKCKADPDFQKAMADSPFSGHKKPGQPAAAVQPAGASKPAAAGAAKPAEAPAATPPATAAPAATAAPKTTP